MENHFSGFGWGSRRGSGMYECGKHAFWQRICYDELRHEKLDLPHHYCVYAGRRDCHTYKHSHEEILARYGRQMKMCDRVPDVLSLDMGNQMYVATLDTATERDAFVRYVQEQAPAQAAKD